MPRSSRGENDEEAARVAGAVAALLALVTAVLVLVGILATPLLVALIAPGFEGEKRELTIAIVRILFPGAGLLVLSAWCLGILNSHRRFLLSYIAPVIWNVSMIVTLLWWGTCRSAAAAGGHPCDRRRRRKRAADARAAARRLEARPGSPLPARAVESTCARRCAISFRCSSAAASCRSARTSTKCWPASCPPARSRGLANAQLLYTLPVSLFGLSVSAAALPAMSGDVGLDAIDAVRDRVNTGLRQIAFFVVPSAVAFLALGDVVAAALFQTGRFTYGDAVYVWAILAGSSIGLAGNYTGAAVFVDVLRAAGHADAAALCARARGIATVLGYFAAIVLPPLLGIDPVWGTVGFTTAASIGGWVELLLLRRSLQSAHRADGLAALSRRAAVECRIRGGRSRMGDQADVDRDTSDVASGDDSRSIRCGVFRIDA